MLVKAWTQAGLRVNQMFAPPGNVPDSSSPRRPSQDTTRHAAEKRPPLLRTLENAAGTTPAETAKANSSPQTPHTLYHTIDRRSLHFLFLYTLTRFTISNQYYFTVLMLVIAWRKLDYGSIKCSPPPSTVIPPRAGERKRHTETKIDRQRRLTRRRGDKATSHLALHINTTHDRHTGNTQALQYTDCTTGQAHSTVVGMEITQSNQI